MAINYNKDEQGIVTLTMDRPDKSANVVNKAFGEAFKATIAKLQQDKDTIKGIIITSAKETFLAGADIDDEHRGDDHQQDRTDVRVVEFADRDHELLPDAAGTDEPHYRGAAHIDLEAQQRVAGEARRHLRQHRKPHA